MFRCIDDFSNLVARSDGSLIVHSGCRHGKTNINRFKLGKLNGSTVIVAVDRFVPSLTV